MAYQNPKPMLDDENKVDPLNQQEKVIAEYTQMKNVYFAFVDVLGFKKTFDDNKENPNIEFASAFKNTFQYYSLLMNNARFVKAGNQWNSGQTSDSLYFYTDRIDYLAAFVKIYSHFCLYAMSQDVFFRGGIAKGDLFVDRPHQFYGDCVINAYLLESNIAKKPWIAIDQSTCADLEKEKSVLELLIPQDPPQRNYIRPFAHITDNELHILIDTAGVQINSIGAAEWLRIQENIQKNMKRFEFDDKNYQKYAFLQKKLKESLQSSDKQ